MIVITFSNPKGGTGKTTANLVLAEHIASVGGRVSIIDCDPNRNIVRWAQERTNEGRTIPYRIAPLGNADAMIDQIEAEQGVCDYLLIDLEGTADQVTSLATQMSDLVLVPLTPSYMEASQAERAVRLVNGIGRASRRLIPTKLVFNRTQTAVRGGDERELRQMLANGGADILAVELMNRRAYNSIFHDAKTLQELYGDLNNTIANLSESKRERTLKPIRGAIDNAGAYGRAVLQEVEAILHAA